MVCAHGLENTVCLHVCMFFVGTFVPVFVGVCAQIFACSRLRSGSRCSPSGGNIGHASWREGTAKPTRLETHSAYLALSEGLSTLGSSRGLMRANRDNNRASLWAYVLHARVNRSKTQEHTHVSEKTCVVKNAHARGEERRFGRRVVWHACHARLR